MKKLILFFLLTFVHSALAEDVPAGPSGTVVIGGGGSGGERPGSGLCTGEPPCGKSICPPERPLCNAWDGSCGCHEDKSACAVSKGADVEPPRPIATFTSAVDSESGGIIAILNESVEGIVAHSREWGGGNQKILLPMSQALVRATLIGDGEMISSRWAGWTAWQVIEAQVEVPPFRSIAMLGAKTPKITMELCNEGRNPLLARIFVRKSDGVLAGWIPLDIDHPDLPLPYSLAWTGDGYVSLELSGFVKDDVITLTDETRVYASSSHP